MIEEIKEIIEDCESVQESQESAYTKEQARLSAYARIREIVIGHDIYVGSKTQIQ